MARTGIARRLGGVFVGLAALFAPACGRSVDVAAALQLESVATGWVDAGPIGTTNKLVPVVSFTVKNRSDRTLAPVQVNAVFRRVGDSSEWSNGMVLAAGSSGLAPAAATGRLLIKAAAGYTGEDSERDLLRNSHFVDATVDLFAR